MSTLTNKIATSNTPQVVTLIVDDSTSMRGIADGGRSKSTVATESIQDLVMMTQSSNLGAKRFRFLMNIAKFGDAVTVIAQAQPPEEIVLDKVVFKGNSGRTNMALALEWAATALERSLKECRSMAAYNESEAPPPLVIFISDGENNGPKLDEAATRLRNVEFHDGRVSVIACGIGMKPEHFAVMKGVASSEELAVNIRPSELDKFIAKVGATVRSPQPKKNIIGFLKGIVDAFRTDAGAPAQAPPDPPTEPQDEATEPQDEVPTPGTGENYPPEVQPTPPGDLVPNPNPDPARPTGFQEWDFHMAEGRTALLAGRYAEAEHEFLAAQKHVHDAADGRLAFTLSCLAETHAAQGDAEKAAPFAIGALDLLSRLGPSTALSEVLEAAEMQAELWSIVDKQRAEDEPGAEDLWIRIATFWEGSAASLPHRAGGLTALGFGHKEQKHVSEATRNFEQARKMGGVGAMGALRGLIAINYDNAGREGAEPFLEYLKDEVVHRFGKGHSLSSTVCKELRISYMMGGKREKIVQLDRECK